ncbi:hypothetical protein JCM11641_004686, partial [Rhodosporidiobolus odoratus]
PSQNITAGQTYVLLTTGPSLLADSILAGPAILSLDTANLTVGPFDGAAASGTAGAKHAVATGAKDATNSGAASVKMGLAGAAVAAFGVLGLVF